jgi:Zn-dependent protease
MEYFAELLASFLAVVVVISLHEFAHAFVAYKCGDPTAKFAGRMTLNPVKHFDLWGMLCFALAGFGWAKPVPINPYNFRNYRRGSFFTSVAGIAVNYLSAFFFYPLYIWAARHIFPAVQGTYMVIFLQVLLISLYRYSLSFCVFNLLPFYPLDGFRIVEALDKRRGKVFLFLRNYGYYILLGLILINIVSSYLPILNTVNILGYFMHFAVNILGAPISELWGFILKL